MIKNGFLSRKYRFELKILAKYYLFSEKLDINHIKPILISFCEHFLIGFNIDVHYEMINSTILYLKSKKCKYIILDGIFISDEFVQFFLKLEEEEDVKKFLFSLAVFGEINKKIGYGIEYIPSVNNYKDVKESANIVVPGDVYMFIKELRDKKFLDMDYRKIIKLLFLNDIPAGELVYKITDFKTLGLWFDFYQGKKEIHLCEKCGGLFKKRTSKPSSQKYCNDCVGRNSNGIKIKRTNNKAVVCNKCQKIFFAGNKNKTNLCGKCYSKHRKEYTHKAYKTKRQG